MPFQPLSLFSADGSAPKSAITAARLRNSLHVGSLGRPESRALHCEGVSLGRVVGVCGFVGASRTMDHTIFKPDQQGGCSRESQELGRNCTADAGRVSPDERQMNVSGAISVVAQGARCGNRQRL